MSLFKDYLESVIVNLESWAKDCSIPYKKDTYGKGDYALLAIGVVDTEKGGVLINFVAIEQALKINCNLNLSILFGLVQVVEKNEALGVLVKEGEIQQGEVPRFELVDVGERYPVWLNPVTNNVYVDLEILLSSILTSSKLLETCHIDLFEISKLLGKDCDMVNFYERLIAIRKDIIKLN